jgi:hypothetical protein
VGEIGASGGEEVKKRWSDAWYTRTTDRQSRRIDVRSPRATRSDVLAN